MQQTLDSLLTFLMRQWALLKQQYVSGSIGLAFGVVIGYVAANLISFVLVLVIFIALLMGLGMGAYVLFRQLAEKP